MTTKLRSVCVVHETSAITKDRYLYGVFVDEDTARTEYYDGDGNQGLASAHTPDWFVDFAIVPLWGP